MSTSSAKDQPAGGSSAIKRPVRRRNPKPDATIAEAIEQARQALIEEFPSEMIGDHLSVSVDDERVMTHRFRGTKRGYPEWDWYATLSRAPRAKNITICELGLLPSEQALLAPAWVPWSERVLPEDTPAPQEDPVAEEDPQEEDSTEEDLSTSQEGESSVDETESEAEESDPAEKRRARRRRYRTRSKT